MLEGNNLLETDFTLNMLNAEGEYIPVNAESKGMRELFCQDVLVSYQDLFLVKFLR